MEFTNNKNKEFTSEENCLYIRILNIFLFSFMMFTFILLGKQYFKIKLKYELPASYSHSAKATTFLKSQRSIFSAVAATARRNMIS